jgi:hypothetical protein
VEQLGVITLTPLFLRALNEALQFLFPQYMGHQASRMVLAPAILLPPAVRLLLALERLNFLAAMALGVAEERLDTPEMEVRERR